MCGNKTTQQRLLEQAFMTRAILTQCLMMAPHVVGNTRIDRFDGALKEFAARR